MTLELQNINTTGAAKRSDLMLAVDVSTTNTPDYRLVGYKVNGSSLESSWDTESYRDILGLSHTEINGVEYTQSFEAVKLMAGDYGKLPALLLHYERTEQWDKLTNFKCIVIYGFLGNRGPYQADLFDGCTIEPGALGGEARTEYNFEVKFGGKRTLGTVADVVGTIEFTPNSESVPGA